MLNFLQQKNKKQIIFEYSLRIMNLLLIFIFVSIIVLISLLLPSFFLAKYKNKTVNNQLELIKQKNIDIGESQVVFINNTNKLSVSLSDSSVSPVLCSEIVNKIVSLKNNGIKILSINITPESGKVGKKISISGVATTRDSLTKFDRDIRIDGFFSNVVFPVSNFIKSSNSEFSAVLIL